MDTFDIHTIELLSVSSRDGLVVHYDTKSNRRVYSYRLDDYRQSKVHPVPVIGDVEVTLRK